MTLAPYPAPEYALTFWLAIAALTALAAAFVLWPLVQARRAVPSRAAYEIEVYKAQLVELEREAQRGLIGPEEAHSARLEVQRRMLQADERHRASPAADAGRIGHIATLVAALGVVVIGLGLYAMLGRPDLPDQPVAAREAERRALAEDGSGEQSAPAIAELIGALEQRVAENPEDLEAWLRLGRAFEMTGEVARAAETYARAIEIDDGIAPLHSAFAATSIAAAGGVVTEAARVALARALELDPADPRGRFYSGLSLVQSGERQAALDTWVDLAHDSPADAPWLATLEQQIAALAGELDLDVAALLPERPAGAAGPAPAVAAEGDAPIPDDPAAREQEASGLAADLERSPRDWQGWIRLARLRAAQGEEEAARSALADGAALFERAPFVLQRFQAAAVDLGLAAPGTVDRARGPTADQMQAAAEMSPEEQQEMIRGMVEGLAARLRSEPDDLEGWLMLGRSWQVLGETGKSVEAFERALALLPEDAPERTELEATIESLRES